MKVASAYTSGNTMVSARSITDQKGYDMTNMMGAVLGRWTHTAPRQTALDRFNRAMALHRSRARLAALEPHLLDDIGIDRQTAAEEASRPIWDAPDSWFR